jgi:hypothetical protein
MRLACSLVIILLLPSLACLQHPKGCSMAQFIGFQNGPLRLKERVSVEKVRELAKRKEYLEFQDELNKMLELCDKESEIWSYEEDVDASCWSRWQGYALIQKCKVVYKVQTSQLIVVD